MKAIITILSLAAILAGSCKEKKHAPEKAGNDTEVILPATPAAFVADSEHLFTPEQVAELNGLIAAHEKETSNEVVVVTMDLDSSIVNEPHGFEDYSLHLFNKWGVGKKGKDNGVGILIAANLRRIRIEVGKGLTAKLTDEEAKKIIDDIITPQFKRQDYFTGVRYGLQAIMNEIK